MSRIARTLGLALGLLCGIIASQAPEFAQQYRQRLGGAIDELRRIVARFEADARATGQSRTDALGKLSGNQDQLVQRQGEAMQWTIERLERFERQQRDFAEAGSFGRLVVLMRDFDRELARAAYRDFEPAVPTTEEGIVTGAAGFIAGWGVFHLIGGLFRGFSSRRRRLHPA